MWFSRFEEGTNASNILKSFCELQYNGEGTMQKRQIMPSFTINDFELKAKVKIRQMESFTLLVFSIDSFFMGKCLLTDFLVEFEMF